MEKNVYSLLVKAYEFWNHDLQPSQK